MIRKMKLSFIFTVVTLLLCSTVYASQTIINTKRMWGINRYATSSSVALDKWAQSDYAILAYGEDFPDALSAAPLAKKYNAPILLTETNAIPEETLSTIEQLRVKNIIIIGGTGIISSTVQDKLNSMGINTSRIFGQDRYETGIKVAEQLDNVTEIAIVTGESFSDALSMSPIAVKKNMPIVLVRHNEIPTVVTNYINSHKLTKIYVIGSGTSLNNAVLTGLNNIELITGNDKYEINLNIADKFKNDLDLSTMYLATGEDFADALSGSILAGSNSNPLILVGNNINSVKKYFADNSGTISNIKVLGGVGAVKDEVINELISSSKASTVSKVEILSKGLAKAGTDTVTFKYDILDQNGIDITKTIPASDLSASCVISSVSYAVSFDPETGTAAIKCGNIKDDISAAINLSYKNKIGAGDILCMESSAASKVSRIEITSKSLTKVGEGKVKFQYRILDENGSDITKTVSTSDIASEATINSGYYAVSLDPLTGTGTTVYPSTLGNNIVAVIDLSCKNLIHTSATLYLEGSPTQENNTVSQIIIYPDSMKKTGATTVTFKFKIVNKNYEDITKIIPSTQIYGYACAGEGITDIPITIDTSAGICTIVLKSAADTDKTIMVDITDKISGVNATEDFKRNNETANQKVSKIVFTSKLAVDKSGYGYITYKVYDQNGNDITLSNVAKSIRFKCDIGTIKIAVLGGVFTITFNKDVDIDKLTSVTITGYDLESEFSMSDTINTYTN